MKPTKQLNCWLYMKVTPRLSEDKVRQCVDPRLGDEYPPKAVAKVNISYYQVKELSYFHVNLKVEFHNITLNPAPKALQKSTIIEKLHSKSFYYMAWMDKR